MVFIAHNQHAFNDWYFNGANDTYWCELHECEHATEDECAEVIDFANGLSETLVSDDAVDMDIYLATHTVED